MFQFKTKIAGSLRVFVYGTLKPGEVNYKRYCSGKVVDAQIAFTYGKLFDLPNLGYPAMSKGNYRVWGYLLSFSSSDVLSKLDELEDYDPTRQADENEYNRHQIEIYNQQGHSLGLAWVYIMNPEVVTRLGGVFLVNGSWEFNSPS